MGSPIKKPMKKMQKIDRNEHDEDDIKKVDVRDFIKKSRR